MRTLSLLFVCGALAAQGPVAIVENGRAKAVLVVGDAEAAGELARYVEKVTGAKLPGSGKLPARILVGPSVCPPDVAARLGKLARDGYLIETRPGNTLVLAGNGRDGTSFAVYEFLERYAGVRWLWPGDLGEVAPHAASLRVPAVSRTAEPAFVWRDLGPRGALWGALDKWEKERELGVSAAHQRLQALWSRRNRFGGEIVYGGHAMGFILPPAKYGPAHPEYFALVKGKRDWEDFDGKHGKQPCTTNPEVIRITADYCRRLFREHPEFDAVSISPNDGRGFCECDRCRRLDTGAVMNDREDPETGRGGAIPIISDRMITFASQVAEEVVKTNPGKKIILFAYGQYVVPPMRVKAHPAVIVQYTLHASGHWNKRTAEAAERGLSGWSKMATSLGVYEYFTQGNFPDLPRLYPALVQSSVRRLHELGFRYYQTQAGDGYALNGLNFYILGKMLWDPSLDAASIERDYVTTGFGKAAPAVARYFDRLAGAWREAADANVTMNYPRAAEYRRLLEVYPTALRAACHKDLDEAWRLAEGRDRERVSFLQSGFRYFDMTLDAVAKTLPLVEAGWDLSRKMAPPARPDMSAFRAAMESWEARDRYVESLRDDFVLSYVWIRYNDQLRTFNPLSRMREYAKAK